MPVLLSHLILYITVLRLLITVMYRTDRTRFTKSVIVIVIGIRAGAAIRHEGCWRPGERGREQIT